MAILNRTAARSQPRAAPLPRIRLRPLLLIAGVMLVAIAGMQLYQMSRATTASFKIQLLHQQETELETSVRQLEADVASLTSLSRIQRDAARLGLQLAQDRDTVSVNVPLPEQRSELPSRYAPQIEQPEVGGEQASWWHRLLKLLPLY